MAPAARCPTVSVVVTTYNRRDRLREVVEPLLSDPDALEVLVVVDRSHDGSLELLQALSRDQPKLRPLMPEGNLGAARARLFGVERARGEVVLSLDDDVVAAPGLVGGHRSHHAERPHAVVLGYMPTQLPSPRRAGHFATYEYAAIYEEHCRLYERDPRHVLMRFWGGNFSVRRDDYLASIAGADFPLRRHEDRDLGLRFLRRGLEPVFDRSLRAAHRYERSISSYIGEGAVSGAALRMLHVMHENLLGPPSLGAVLPRCSLPTRVVVRCGDLPLIRRFSLRALQFAVVRCGNIGAFPLESAFARLARRLAYRQGAREVDVAAFAACPAARVERGRP